MMKWMCASRNPSALVAAACVVAAISAGCTSNSFGRKSSPRSVSLAEFATIDETADEPDRVEQVIAVQPGSPGSAEPETERGEPIDLAAVTPDPDADSDDTAESAQRETVNLKVGQPVIIDSLIGQVNGRPIFADEFFEPIADQLIAYREEKGKAEFDQWIGEAVRERLRQVVLSELFLAEAEASLTPQEQQGIIAWLRHVEETVVAGYGGSYQEARQRLAEQEGLTLDQYVTLQKNQALINQLLQQKIEKFVIVSWRDVERLYRRNLERYNPTPTLVVSRIAVRTQDAERIEQVSAKLAAGEPFAEVAEFAGEPNGGVWQEWALDESGVEGIEIADEQLKQQIVALDEGETSQAFEVGSRTWWVHVKQLSGGEARSLYEPDVQRELLAALTALRAEEEQNRYIESLLERGIYDELNQMVERLVKVAIRRYG